MVPTTNTTRVEWGILCYGTRTKGVGGKTGGGDTWLITGFWVNARVCPSMNRISFWGVVFIDEVKVYVFLHLEGIWRQSQHLMLIRPWIHYLSKVSLVSSEKPFAVHL
jgi:hypothetical protein